MQHFDDRTVGRHGAAGRESDREHGHGQHQDQDGDAGDNRRRPHGAHALDPAAMIVEAGGWHPGCERLAQRREIRLAAGRRA